ncbi:NADPH-dependent FMN reductase [Streptomyces sp. 110]|uniref:NADPH-dependent FMN reductase n=1 Tax=Streptomyces endocoffeicus TaxID=2898945 RepID=A0ABS1Q8D0_9ACTN|nr:NADPH-dependent FMN reductase [Streptomyces endocoffeicus]MBL1120938.1 NADPH-dependent FMN reductase [Streptomyces endocoffeicus]
MATVLSLSGSPSPQSRTARLLRHLDRRLECQGHTVLPLDIRDLPPEALFGADFAHPALRDVTDLVARADGLVVATPVYKAAYSGALKALLDLLPQHALTGKTVLPLATGGSTAHVLVVDYALRPVLTSMGAHHVLPGWFVLDRAIDVASDGSVVLDEDTAAALHPVVDRFSAALVSLDVPADGGEPTHPPTFSALSV